jgi:S-DNA-T family DNA segregation ATPase FtsK/SpoIIIE
MTTEEASREIARRFAPQGAVAAQSEDLQAFVPAPQPMQKPHPHAQGHGRQTGGIQRAVASEGPAAAPAQPMSVPAAPRNAAGEAHAASAPARRNALFGGLQFRHQNQAARKFPPLNLLKKPVASKAGPEFTQTMLRGNARLLEDVLSDFGVKGEIRDIRPGPVVTLFEFEPARGVKSSRVIGLADDIARSMSATSARVAVVPGRNAIGIELPNTRRDSVLLREVLESEAYKAVDSALPIALGKSIGGEPVVADLARMPHLLVAGTTGSGKSVGVNAMILSLLYRMSPDDCRFLMIDPKMLELSVYNGIPHLLAPVVTDPQKAVSALSWVVGEMEERYKRMSKLSVRNIDVYNNRVRNAKKRGEMISRTVQTGFDRRTGEAVYEQEQMQLETMPYIVVVIDEFADLMMVAGKDVEASVQRLAQMARAAGIHIIMATQRPSVDVITGTIKANFPTRISFKVTSKIDSRTILNEQGAEQLLGQGDMLFAAGSGQIGRVHGAFVADEEVEAITNFLRSQGAPRYVDGITDGSDDAPSDVQLPQGQGEEDLYDRAVAIILRDRKASTSYLQRRLSIGYNRAADLIERMEAEGLISAANHAGKREILAQAGGSASETSATAA